MLNHERTIERIRELARQRRALLLAHNYQRPEVQDIADHVGDSLELSLLAARNDAELIVFCGVHFMAESAAILSPQKRVVLPRREAGCPMAEMITPEQLERFRADHPGAAVVTYVNSTAGVKALSDVCCTSANAQRVVASVEADEVLFTPDRNLAAWVARRSTKRIVAWRGFCPTHEQLSADDVIAARREHPQAPVLAHPECRPEVLDLADAVRSTSGMLEYARRSAASELIIGTELGLLHRLRRENPDKRFFGASPNLVCPNMKLIRLEDVLAALERPEDCLVQVEQTTRLAARRALERMLAVPKDA